MRRLFVMAGLAALAGCGGVESDETDVGTSAQAMLGPNRLGPNRLGPNRLGPNGVGEVGGLTDNGLGPNFAGQGVPGIKQISATDFLLDNNTFRTWFAAGPVEADQAMGYFTRCLLPQGHALVYPEINPATGLSYRWSGQYGVGARSAMRNERMTRDEGLWMSACLIAHVNTKGVHQYISIRGGLPIDGLGTSPGEYWSTRMYYGAFFGDIFTKEPQRYSCTQPTTYCKGAGKDESAVCVPPDWYTELTLGRRCDGFDCWYTSPRTGLTDLIVDNLGWCGDTAALGHDGDAMNTRYSAWFSSQNTWRTSNAGARYHPIYVNGPVFVELEKAASNVSVPADPRALTDVISVGKTPFSASQAFTCPMPGTCLRDLFSTLPATDPTGFKLRGIVGGQAVDAIVRWVPEMWRSGLEPSGSIPRIDPAPPLAQDFTAIIRYSNGKTNLGRQAFAVAGIQTSDGTNPLRAWNGTWPVTTTPKGAPSWDRYQYLQVWPVYGSPNPNPGLSAYPELKVRISGVDFSTACTGPILGRLSACTELDGPHLDAVAFVPGPPSCLPAGATSFRGVCPHN